MDREVIFTDDLVQEATTPLTGKTAARQFFNNKANMDLMIYERWNRPIIEISTEGGGEPKSTVKRQQTFEHMVDLVSDIFAILSLLFDIQGDASTVDGYGARIRASPRRQLEGWDFADVATFEETVHPKVASLKETGLGWVDLVRSVNAVTLFGVGFGELVKPELVGELDVVVQLAELEGGGSVVPDSTSSVVDHIPSQSAELEARVPTNGGIALLQQTGVANTPTSNSICGSWPSLPTGKDLLATTTSTIKDIRNIVYRDPDTANQPFWELMQISTGISLTRSLRNVTAQKELMRRHATEPRFYCQQSFPSFSPETSAVRASRFPQTGLSFSDTAGSFRSGGRLRLARCQAR